jgi:hypothetical protein
VYKRSEVVISFLYVFVYVRLKVQCLAFSEHCSGARMLLMHHVDFKDI